MIKYGIVSTASIVERFVAGVRESKDGYIQAIASRTVESAKALAKQLEIDCFYGSYEALYKDESIDVIYIPTVNGFHYKEAKQALEHHKHVIVEKPFTLSVTQARELFEIAERNQCFLMEAQKAVFLPTTQKVKELIENNVIGKVKYIEFKAGFPGRFDYDHWMYDLSLGGGALYGSATYTIEYIQYLFDSLKMDINGTCIKCLTGSDEICNFQLKINNDILVSSTIAMNVSLKNEAVFYGDLGYIIVPNYWKANKLELHLNDGNIEVFDFPYQSEFVYEIEHIHQCIKNDLLESPVMNREKTFKTIALVDELYKQW